MKERLDIALVNRGLAPSREKAKASIMAGIVYVDNQKVDKAGTLVDEKTEITVKGNPLAYVSRGGLKLEKAIDVFGINLEGKVMADIGASTGGFTDCALQKGACLVYAIDVGYGQLAWQLRTDARVVNMERTNIRNVTYDDVGRLLDFATIDVAFISLEKVFPVLTTLLSPQGEAIALIKPQFEAGRDKVGKKGVVKDPSVHCLVIHRVLQTAEKHGLYPLAITYSPVKGPEGNIEYLVHLTKDDTCDTIIEGLIEQTVADAHARLPG